MKSYAAERRLLVSEKGSTVRTKLVVRIGIPCVAGPDDVEFETNGEAAACEVEIAGLREPFSEVIYGADLLQALQLAADVEPVLKRLSKKYDIYFESGEPYFE